MEEELNKCAHNEGEMCSSHKVLVERRNADRIRIDNHERIIGGLLTFKNTLIGVGLLGICVVLGGYYYTHEHKIESGLYIRTNMESIKQLKTSVSDLKTQLAVVSTNYEFSARQIKEQNELIKELIKTIGKK